VGIIAISFREALGDEHGVHGWHGAGLDLQGKEEPRALVLHVLPPVGIKLRAACAGVPVVAGVDWDETAATLASIAHLAGPSGAHGELIHEDGGKAGGADNPIDPKRPIRTGATVADEEVCVALRLGHNVRHGDGDFG
jgi:hypothetical protein